MASTINTETLNRIHTAIAAAGDAGTDTESLAASMGMAENTIRTACRELVAIGNIETRSVKSEATKRRKNLYVSIKPPISPEGERLAAIAQLLAPMLTQTRYDWDGNAIREAYQLAIGATHTSDH